MNRALLLSLVVSLLGACGKPPRAAPQVPPAPKIVVTIVVDQLAAWLAEERLALLPADGGFARLRREGTSYTRMRFAHAVTDTGPGHASLYTGAPPREHGMFANESCAPDGDRKPLLYDPDARVVTLEGVGEGPFVSAKLLGVPTLADRLRAERPESTIVSVSLKDRAALLPVGGAADAAVWFVRSRGLFATSSAVAETLPEWATPIVGQPLPSAAWELLDAEWVRRNAASADDAPGEGDILGYGTSFPHDATAPGLPPTVFALSPSGDDIVLRLAIAAVDARRPDVPMLLAVSLSTFDLVGHTFGPDSWEAWDALRQLDARLAVFFAELDARVGPDGWAVVLSGDHGIVAMPEAAPSKTCGDGDWYQRPCGHTRRILSAGVVETLEAAAARALGPGKWIACLADPFVWPSAEALALPPERRALLADALVKSAEGIPGIARALVHTSAACPSEEDESLEALLCRTLPPRLEGVVYLVPAVDAFFEDSMVAGKGVSHGAPYRYDRTVPLLVRAPGRVEASRVVAEPVSFRRFREEVEALLGL